MTDEPIEPVISAAVGTAVVSKVPGLGERIEAAMVAATVAAQADGVTDPAEILERKMAAKDAVLAEMSPAAETAEQDA